ncbi:MAG TPA: Ig-like domain-containing protein, partial [Ilumatobacteraceae bacterium]
MSLLAILGLAPAIALTLPSTPASAASAPVARADVARTDSGTAVDIFTSTNDFDPDGDDFSVSSIVTPAHGTVSGFGNGFNYTPNPGFSGVETITYTIQDSTGLTADGLVTIFVDTGVIGPQTPLLDTDYLYVYQGSAVSFTTAELLGNDADPQGQTI